jgi:flagellin
MSLVVNTNVLSLITQTNLASTTRKLDTSIEQLSSGFRINSAADDPAGLAISTDFQSQINGLNQAVQNANAAIAQAQTGDGALGSITNLLQQLRTISVEAANGTNSTTDLQDLQNEFTSLGSEISREVTGTTFNGVNILNTTGTITFQVGANQGDTISVTGTQLNTGDALATALADTVGSATVLSDITSALGEVNTDRSNFGANEIRFQQVVSTLQVDSQNTAAANSQVLDTNFAQATSNLTQAQVVQQAGVALLSQANAQPQQVLALLQHL